MTNPDGRIVMITHTARHRLSKALCISLAIIHGWFASISPARAFAPVAVIGAPAIIATGAMTFPIAAIAGIVGIVGMYLLISDAADNQVAIPLGQNERNAVPAPSAAATASQTQITEYIGSGSNWTADYAAACSDAVAYQQALNPTMSYQMVIQNGGCGYKQTVNGVQGAWYPLALNTRTQPGCPEGYTTSETTCVLANPRKVTDDKRCDLLLQNGQFSTADDLNCSDTADGSKAAPLIRNGKAIVIGQNSSGQPLIMTVSPAETIGDREWVTVKIEEQVQTATETQVKTTTATIDSQTSTVTGVQTQTKPGSIVMPSGGTLPTTSPTTDVTTTPTTQTGTETQGDVTVNTCGLPGQPACAIDDTGFATQPKPWEADPDGPTLDDIKDKIQNLDAPEIGWDWLPSILPGQSIICHPLEFTGTITAGPAAGLTATEPLDLCPYFDYVRMFLGFLFGAGTVLYIWKRFLGARSEFSAITEYD